MWASLKRAMEGEAAEMETADTTHVLVQVLLSSAASETAGTQDLAARLLDLYYKAVEAGSSRGRGQLFCPSCHQGSRRTYDLAKLEAYCTAEDRRYCFAMLACILALK